MGVKLGLALALCLIMAGVYLQGYSHGEDHERAKWQAEATKASEQARSSEAADLARRDASERKYLDRIRQLETLVAAPVQPQPIRLCKQAGVNRTSQTDPATGTDAAGAAGEPVLQASDDIGPALRDYGRVCESLRIQLEELIGWAAQVSGNP